MQLEGNKVDRLGDRQDGVSKGQVELVAVEFVKGFP